MMDPYLQYLPVTDSTNDDAKAAAREGAAHGSAIYAGHQRSGRGRSGRTWHAADGENLYLSVVLTRDTARAPLQVLPFLAGVCLAQWLAAETPVAFGLKWPNDVLVGDRKLGGILCEATPARFGGVAAVVGIGMNVNAPRDALPEAIRDRATSLRHETDRTFDVEAIARALRLHVVRWYDTLIQAGPRPIFERWCHHEGTFGRRVRIVDEALDGTAVELAPDGALRVRLDDGTSRLVRAGDIEFTDLH